jgi:hypothetical protein
MAIDSMVSGVQNPPNSDASHDVLHQEPAETHLPLRFALLQLSSAALTASSLDVRFAEPHPVPVRVQESAIQVLASADMIILQLPLGIWLRHRSMASSVASSGVALSQDDP